MYRFDVRSTVITCNLITLLRHGEVVVKQAMTHKQCNLIENASGCQIQACH